MDRHGADRAAAQPADAGMVLSRGTTLNPYRHPQRDFFVADILDAVPKGDLASMEHPLFALKPGDHRVRRYDYKGHSVEIQPGAKGMATIYDKDIWIYCVSQLVEAMNRGRTDPGPTVRFTAYGFLVATNRGTSGDSYARLGDALERLRGTSIITNIETAGRRERNGFGLIDSFRIVERGAVDRRMAAISVTLPEWLYRSVQASRVLTLSRDYFRIRKALDRRIYELVRKHCGRKAKWKVSLAILHAKSGSTASIPKFRMNVKALAACGGLPDYRAHWNDADDSVTFYSRGPDGVKAQLQDAVHTLTRNHRKK